MVLDGIKEHFEEYNDILQEVNDTIKSGIDSLKTMFNKDNFSKAGGFLK